MIRIALARTMGVASSFAFLVFASCLCSKWLLMVAVCSVLFIVLLSNYFSFFETGTAGDNSFNNNDRDAAPHDHESTTNLIYH
jgi:hypothetical protein